MVLGIICAICCLFLLSNYVIKKAHAEREYRIWQKSHQIIGCVLLLFIFLHIGSTCKVWSMRNIFVVLTGFLLLAGVVFVILTFVFRKYLKESWIKYHRAGSGLILLALIAHVAVYMADFYSYRQAIKEIEIKGMDAEGIADGIYEGSCDVGYIRGTVRVTVENEKITEIELCEHKNERGKKAEDVLDVIKQRQETNVETVSGATNSSLVLEKAVENALEEGKRK